MPDRQVLLSSRLARRASSTAPKRFSGLRLGSVKPRRLTMRAPDDWDSVRFSGCFLSDGSSPFPSLALASRR